MAEDLVLEESGEEDEEDTGLVEYNISSYPADFTLRGLWDKWKEASLEIPGFQRKYVWKHDQASRLIESFMLGLPVPGIFLYKDRETQKFLVVDGQQRLMSVFYFFEGAFPGGKRFSLDGLATRWNGLTYQQFSPPDKLRLADTVMRAVVISQQSPNDDTSIYHVFERLNTGGTPLNQQEVRNCVYAGPITSLLIELNEYSNWRRILGRSQPDNRQRDVELVLRVLALTEAGEEYQKPMKDFLSKFMASHRSDNQTSLERLANLFKTTCDRIVASLGDKPFHIRVGLNSAALDSTFVAFAKQPGLQGDIRKKYRDFVLSNSYHVFSPRRTSETETVRGRIRVVSQALAG